MNGGFSPVGIPFCVVLAGEAIKGSNAGLVIVLCSSGNLLVKLDDLAGNAVSGCGKRSGDGYRGQQPDPIGQKFGGVSIHSQMH